MDVTPTMVTTGPRGTMARRPIGGEIIDHWTWTPIDKPEVIARMVCLRLEDGMREVWVMPTMDRADEPGQTYAQGQLSTKDDAVAREVCRHLARQAAHGEIPMPPVSSVDRAIWAAAVEISESFIERFGVLADVQAERRKR